jgi:protein-tyrosine-phosphatase
MAEGFANHYGQDVLQASSSGLAPTVIVARETVETMARKNIDISAHFPKKFDPVKALDSDLIINMSRFVLPGKLKVPIEDWKVHDPFGDSMEVYLKSANEVEMKVMALILRLRRAKH